MNDIQIHWASVCQLLSETLQNLNSVYEKCCHITDVFEAELVWLNEIVDVSSLHKPMNGNIQLIMEEIDHHKVTNHVILNAELGAIAFTGLAV